MLQWIRTFHILADHPRRKLLENLSALIPLILSGSVTKAGYGEMENRQDETRHRSHSRGVFLNRGPAA